MVFGAHLVLYSTDADADRRFLAAEVESLAAGGVSCSSVEEAKWGSITKITLPSGSTIGLYQPKHPLALQRPG